MADRLAIGMLDTSAFIDLPTIDPASLPKRVELSAVTLAELYQGIAMAPDEIERSARQERLTRAQLDFEPLAFDGPAATRYGTLVGRVVAAGRDPKRRRLDLMIAATASIRGLPLFTRNPDDFRGLDGVVTVVGV